MNFLVGFLIGVVVGGLFAWSKRSSRWYNARWDNLKGYFNR